MPVEMRKCQPPARAWGTAVPTPQPGNQHTPVFTQPLSVMSRLETFKSLEKSRGSRGWGFLALNSLFCV